MKKYKNIVIFFLIIIFYIIVADLKAPSGLDAAGWKALILMICIIIVWVTGIIPIGISSCVALFLPELLHISTTNNMLQNFAITPLFFMLASTVIAKVYVDTGISSRVALYTIGVFGNNAKKVVLSFMVWTAVISAFMADIPTAMIMGSLAKELLEKNNCKVLKSNMGKALMVGIPVAAAIGGFATPVGNGINILCINILKETTGITFGFLQWCAIGIPLSLIMTIIAWISILIFFNPEIDTVKGIEDIKERKKSLGKMNTDEKKFLIIFSITMILWLTEPLTGLNTTLVSLIAVVILMLPKIELTDCRTIKDNVSWETLFLVGSSNALAALLGQTGMLSWVSNVILSTQGECDFMTLLFLVTAFGIFIHLIVPVAPTVATVCIPIVTTMAVSVGINALYMIIPIAMTSSCVFLLPVDSIPLTTYGYGYWKFKDMVKPGIVISLVWIPVLAGIILAAIQLGII